MSEVLTVKDKVIKLGKDANGFYQLTDLYKVIQGDFQEDKSAYEREYGKTITISVDRTELYMFCAFICPAFSDAVYSVFDQTSIGDANGAIDTAVSVVLTEEILGTVDELTKDITDELPKWLGKQGNVTSIEEAEVLIWDELILPCVTNIATSELKKSFDIKSLKDYLIKSDHVEGLGAYLEMMKFTLKMLRNGMDYYLMKAILVEEV